MRECFRCRVSSSQRGVSIHQSLHHSLLFTFKKYRKADDGWSLLSLSRHNKQLIREYVEVINILTHQHRKQLNKLSAVINTLRDQNKALECKNQDLTRQLTAANRQVVTVERKKLLEEGNVIQRSIGSKVVPIGGQKRKANALAGISIANITGNSNAKKDIALTQRNYDVPRFSGTMNPPEARVVSLKASTFQASPIKAKLRMPDNI